jgi:hypothetical protein
MQKALIFLVVLLIVLALVFWKPSKEGFTELMGVNWNSMNEGTPAALYTKLPINEPKTVTITEAGVGNIQPSPPPPSDIPTAPYEQRAKENPNPYRNPTNEPAKYIRLLGVKEDLQAFFGFQAGELETSSDPSIQIPLTRARADMGELIDVQSVMERNPGLPSRINVKQLEDIQSNLNYLRAVLNDLVNSGAIQMTAPLDSSSISQGFEGFEDLATGPRATLKELQDFQIRVVVELKRLYATGTSDPVVQARINTLNRIKDDIDDVITKIQQNFYNPSTVPIFKSDIEKALPVLGKPTDPLPQILQKTNLPPAIASLFPGGLSPKDQEQAVQITNVMKGYMKNLFEGASWGFSFKYDNPNIAKLKAEAAKEDKSGGEPPLVSGLPGVKNGGARFSGTGVGLREPLQTQDISRELPTDPSFDDGLPGTTINRTLPTPESGSLDWKERSQQIKEQVRRRGMNPMDFGAMPEDAIVGPDFSWRGYAMMMCMRLNTTMDPGLAQSCGCPPQNWSGWKQ